MNPLRVDKFYAALMKAIKESFAALKTKYAGQRIYGYALVVGDLMQYAMAAAHTEEALDNVAEKYVKQHGYKAKKGDPHPLLRDLLRYSVDDGWHHQTDPDPFEPANAMLEECGDPYGPFYEDGGTRLAEELFLAALHESYSRNVFGKDQSVTVMLYTGDDAEKDILRWVKRANPPEVYERFVKEGKAGNKAARLIDSGHGDDED